jgi:transposase
LFEQGKSIGEIAKERGVLVQTIFGHLAKFVENGSLEIERIVAKNTYKILRFFSIQNSKNPENMKVSTN